ncbi:MAG: phage terminase large subunit [Oscillospiraceae bacterium]
MYEYRPTGAQILFRGLDDAGKLKSIKPRRGTFRYCWFEEFAELNGANFARNVLQSVMRGQGTNPQVFRSFNPPISKANWANQFVAEPDAQGITFHTTYKDIPAEWLGEAFIAEAERLEAVNEQAYRHEYLGRGDRHRRGGIPGAGSAGDHRRGSGEHGILLFRRGLWLCGRPRLLYPLQL